MCTITVYCKDKQGNPSQDYQRRVAVAIPFELEDLSPRSYLKDLLLFAAIRLKADQVNYVTPKLLADTFHQPFDRLVVADQDVLDRPVHRIRLCIEVLRMFFTPPPTDAHAHWTFDEGSGTTTADATGNGNNGTLQGPIWEPGRVGMWALEFDGVDDYVQIGAKDNLVMTDFVSISAWIYPTGPGSTAGGVIVNKEDEYEVARFPDGTIGWAFNNDDPDWNWHHTDYQAPENQWTHIAVVYDRGTVNTYANGELRDTYLGKGQISAPNPANDDFRIGGRQRWVQHFQGFIDDVRLYDRPLGAREVTVLAIPQAKLVAHWKFDEGSGTTTADATGNGSNGTLQGSTWTSGKIGHAVDFEGEDLVEVSGQASLKGLSNTFSLAFWANPRVPHNKAVVERRNGTDGTSGQRHAIDPVHGEIYGPREENHAGAGVSVGTDGIRVFEHTGGYMPALLVHNAPISGWTHVAVVYEDRQPMLYVNGSLVRIGLRSLMDVVHIFPRSLGAVSPGAWSYGHFQGQLDDVRVYDHALRPWEVADLAGTLPKDDAPKEQAYREAAYQTLLNNLGTSYEEIRLARAAAGDEDDEARKELAARLGIVLGTSRPDQLERLFLPLEQVTEADLERLFGLVNTERDPLSEGAKLGDKQGQILRWNLDGVEWKRNTDPEGTIYVRLSKPADGVFRVELYRDRDKTVLVASGERNTAKGTVELSEKDGSGLSGRFDIKYVSDTDDIEVSAVPNLLSWSLEYLRALWRKQDWSNDALVGTGDGLFATYFDNPDLTGKTVTRIDPRVAFNWGDGSPDPAIGAESFSARWTSKVLALYSEPYTFYTETDDGVKLWVDNQLLIDEWHSNNQPYEKTINLQAGRLYDIRMDYFKDSGNANATLLWSSPTTPKAIVPQSHLFSGTNDRMLSNRLPIIDPDLVGPEDLKNPKVGDPAYDLWKDRRDWVAAQLNEIKSQRESKGTLLAGFDHIVGKVLPELDLKVLAKERKEGGDIEARLRKNQLGIQAFDYLVRIHKLAAIDQNQKTVLPSEWNDVYSILVQVLKLRIYDSPYKDPWSAESHESWREKEQLKKLILGPDHFKIPEVDTSSVSPPPDLPAWRATSQAREKWQRTLRGRIEQQQGVAQALQETVDATEEATLPLLRDALVSAIGLEHAAIDVAEALAQRLLVDVKSSGYPKTTRVDQAAETLQGILFSCRADRFRDRGDELGPNPTAGWKLDTTSSGYTEADFDQEFKWMGSYDTWRAAVSAFYYPENVLLPRMRREQAPVPHPHPRTDEFFNIFIEKLRGQGALTPEKAREAANVYLQAVIPKDASIRKVKVPDGEEVQLTDQLSEAQLSDRRRLVEELVNANDADEARPYLEEIFFFVPLHLALQLQQAGHYLTALDWFQTVYAYNLPADTDQETGQRKIYKPLNLDSSEPEQVRRTIEWLLHYMDPHRVAANRANAYTRFVLMSLARCFLEYADSEFVRDTDESLPKARALYTNALDVLDSPEMTQAGAAVSSVTFPPNPLPRSLRSRAQLNLFKLRTGRNFAGMRRQIAPAAQGAELANDLPVFGEDGQLIVPGQHSFQPTPYYYSVLIERAKQLVGICQQVEAAYLSALEKTDAENYNLLQAGHALDLAKASVDLQNLREVEARDGEELANRQKSRAKEQATTYSRLIAAGPNQYEQAMLRNYREANSARNFAAGLDAAITIAQASTTAAANGFFGTGLGGAWGPAAVVSASAVSRAIVMGELNDAELRAQENSFRASHERRVEEWKLQRSMAEKDISIGDQQIQLAKDHLAVTQQEGRIARMQSDHAKEVADFLANKFMNAELYEWMTGVLAQVYGYFLRQTTAVAQLAQNQLAFERQEVPPSLIQADYWQPTSDSGTSAADGEPDRRGLTGSARLLQDIYQLDQYAFETNERKLQLTHTISLAQAAPLEFQRFRETGTLLFATPMEMFDRLFPGHYLRLIRQVRTSVIALVPPTQGIRATLSASGVSRVATGGDAFRTTVVRRDPELVALSSPMNATGLFELDPQSEMLRPFEAMGVDTYWEFQMPKTANRFDYRTIADVLITIDYTALNSYEYRQQVIQSLNRDLSADRSFSFHQHLPDQFYALNNPDQVEDEQKRMVVNFETTREDFPPNVEGLRIQNLMLCFVRADGVTDEVKVHHLLLKGETSRAVGAAISREGIISTRRGSWGAMTGDVVPVGEWELDLSGDPRTKDLFENGQIEDILFVITYVGRTLEWPV